MNPEIIAYNEKFEGEDIQITQMLASILDEGLTGAENKIWHGHPVWFLDGNPIVGYSKQKKGIRLMFWSGADFEEVQLNVRGKKFKDASIFYNSISLFKLFQIHQHSYAQQSRLATHSSVRSRDLCLYSQVFITRLGPWRVD